MEKKDKVGLGILAALLLALFLTRKTKAAGLDSSLSSLSTSAGKLVPVFNSKTLNYAVTNGISSGIEDLGGGSSCTFTWEVTDPTYITNVNFYNLNTAGPTHAYTIGSGTTDAIALQSGDNHITCQVAAQNPAAPTIVSYTNYDVVITV